MIFIVTREPFYKVNLEELFFNLINTYCSTRWYYLKSTSSSVVARG